MSADLCAGMSQEDWDCIVKQGYTFTIIQAISGGYGINPNLATCVSRAWAAGMAHVDLYAFMCNQCYNNNPPSTLLNELVSTAKNQGIKYGQIWIDVGMILVNYARSSNHEAYFQQSNAAIVGVET